MKKDEKKEDKQEKKEQLLSASYDLFMNKGVEETSIQDIVNEAHTGKGTFYYYFKDKQDVKKTLINAVAQRLINSSIKNVKKQEIEFLADQIIFISNDIINIIKKDKKLIKFIAMELSYEIYKNAVNDLYLRNESSLLKIFSEGKKQNGEKLKNPKIMMSTIIELITSTSYNSILFSEPVPIEEYKPFLFNYIRVLIEDENS